jgi:hypothetical protein
MTNSRRSLSTLRLPAILRLVAGLGRTAHVSAVNGPWTFEAWFERGHVVAVTRPPDRGLDALETAEYLFQGGDFEMTPGDRGPDQKLDLTPDQLAQYLDRFAAERAELSRVMPSLWAVPARRWPSQDAARQVSSAEADSLDWSLSINGVRSVAELIGTQQPLTRLRTLARMVTDGAIEISTPQAPGTWQSLRSPQATTANDRYGHDYLLTAPAPPSLP